MLKENYKKVAIIEENYKKFSNGTENIYIRLDFTPKKILLSIKRYWIGNGSVEKYSGATTISSEFHYDTNNKCHFSNSGSAYIETFDATKVAVNMNTGSEYQNIRGYQIIAIE